MKSVNETPGTVEAIRGTLRGLEGKTTLPAGLEVTNLAEVDLFYMRAKETDGRAVEGLVARTRTVPHAYYFVGNLSFPSGEIAAELDQRLPEAPAPTPAPDRGPRLDLERERRRAAALEATAAARQHAAETSTGFGTTNIPSPNVVNPIPGGAKRSMLDDLGVEEG